MKIADITQKDIENCIDHTLDLLYEMDQYLICHRGNTESNEKKVMSLKEASYFDLEYILNTCLAI